MYDEYVWIFVSIFNFYFALKYSHVCVCCRWQILWANIIAHIIYWRYSKICLMLYTRRRMYIYTIRARPQKMFYCISVICICFHIIWPYAPFLEIIYSSYNHFFFLIIRLNLLSFTSRVKEGIYATSSAAYTHNCLIVFFFAMRTECILHASTFYT